MSFIFMVFHWREAGHRALLFPGDSHAKKPKVSATLIDGGQRAAVLRDE